MQRNMKKVVENKYVVVNCNMAHKFLEIPTIVHAEYFKHAFVYLFYHPKLLSETFPLNQMYMYLAEDPSDLKLHCQY